MDEKLKRAFYLGFMCSREGFNAECAFDHCCQGLNLGHQTEEEFMAMMDESWAFQECLSDALNKLNSDLTGSESNNGSGDGIVNHNVEKALNILKRYKHNKDLTGEARSGDSL
jgi:hypothetical protein